jgi:hypothetical protein
MADREISGLTAGTDPKAALFHAVQSGNSRKFVGDVVGHQFRGAHVHMTSDDTTVNATGGYTLSFDAATFDTDTFWSAGAPTRLTIPASLGIAYVEVTGQIQVSATTADNTRTLQLIQRDSGDTIKRLWHYNAFEGGGTGWAASIHSGPVAVAAGDYFAITYTEEGDTSITVEGDGTGRCFIAIQVIGMTPV